MHHAKVSRKTSITVQRMQHLATFTEAEVLVVPMRAYDLLLRLTWFRARNLQIVSNLRRVIGLRSPNGPHAADILGGEEKPPPEGHKKLPELPEDTPAPDIQSLRAIRFGNLLASDEVVEASALRIGEYTGVLGATVGTTTLAGQKPRRWTQRAGSSGGSCGRRASTRRRLNDSYRLAESRRESCGLRSFSIGRAGGTTPPGLPFLLFHPREYGLG
jgi:hypothetical protein